MPFFMLIAPVVNGDIFQKIFQLGMLCTCILGAGTKEGKWKEINDALRRQIRGVMLKKNEEPSVAIVDSQSVKTVQSGNQRGYDAGKKNKGSKTTYCC